jgi:bifunctional oligoribonuclease and PAP phosphatase NrnA
MSSINKFISHIKEGKNDSFLLIAHERPDGDTVSAVLALRSMLLSKKKKVQAVSSQGVPEVFRFLNDWYCIKEDFLAGDFQTIVLVDNGDLKRTGFMDRILSVKKRKVTIVNIDHHPKNDIWKLANINIVDEKASSTCEIIYNIFEKAGTKIDHEIATALLTGIYTDTGGFQHATITAKTLEIASKLMSRGAKLKKISGNISNFKSIPMLKLWGIVLDRVISRPDFGLNFSVITRNDIQKCQAREEDLAGVVNLIATIPDEKASLLLYELPNGKIKGSLRTENNEIDVSRIAALFGGGGHKRASGFEIDGRLRQNKDGWEVV